MRVERFALDGDPGSIAARVRALAPDAASVAAPVREILARVRDRGDAAVQALTSEHDLAGGDPAPLRVDADVLAAAHAALDEHVAAGLELALANATAVAAADVGADRPVELPQGQRIVVRELPVRRAAVYVPGGRAPYPSTVVMGTAVARAAGVEQIAVCAPPRRDGELHPTILGACALCGVDEVYRMGGAQSIAALAYGTRAVPPVDVIVGPGNLWVQEAKRQVFGTVAIDGFAGPSDLLVIFDETADPRLVALDLLAQAEHGEESLVLAASPSPAALARLAALLPELAADRPTVVAPAAALVQTTDLEAALAFAEAFAPEHLELVGPEAEALASRVRSAGCLFVGPAGATAFGDYVAGSNHVLPTGGAARFASALSPRHFRRRMAEVHLAAAAGALAGPGAAIADAEGFAVHAESMRARIRENGSR